MSVGRSKARTIAASANSAAFRRSCWSGRDLIGRNIRCISGRWEHAGNDGKAGRNPAPAMLLSAQDRGGEACLRGLYGRLSLRNCHRGDTDNDTGKPDPGGRTWLLAE